MRIPKMVTMGSSKKTVHIKQRKQLIRTAGQHIYPVLMLLRGKIEQIVLKFRLDEDDIEIYFKEILEPWEHFSQIFKEN